MLPLLLANHALVLSAYGIGTLILLFFDTSSLGIATVLFFKLLLSWTCSVVFFSLYWTHGKSVHILILLMMFYVLFVMKQENRFKFGLDRVQILKELPLLLGLLAVTTFFMLLQGFRSGMFDDKLVYISNWDDAAYASLAEYLRLTGIESSSPWYFSLTSAIRDAALQPYHYGEMWFLSLLQTLSPTDSLSTYIYLAIPLLMTLIYSGLTAFLETLKTLKPIDFVVTFAILLMIAQIPFKSGGYPFSVFLMPKIFSLYLGLCLFGIALFMRKSGKLAFVLMGVPAIFNFLYLPITVVALFFYFLYQVVRRRREALSEFPMISLLFFTAIPLFYVLFGSSNQFYSDQLHISQMASARVIGACALLFFKSAWFYFYPLALLIFFSYKGLGEVVTLEKHRHFCQVMIALSLSGFFLYGIFHNHYEGWQFFAVVQIPLAAIGCLYLYGSILSSQKTLKTVFLFCTTVLIFQGLCSVYNYSFVNQYRDHAFSRKYIAAVKEKLKDIKNPIGVYYSANENSYSSDPRFCFSAAFIKYTAPYRWVVEVSLPKDRALLNRYGYKPYFERSPFYGFMDDLKKQNKFISIGDSQARFIERYHIEYILVERGASLSKEVFSLVDSGIEDAVAGNKLFMVRKI